jgi:hypothetical protein
VQPAVSFIPATVAGSRIARRILVSAGSQMNFSSLKDHILRRAKSQLDALATDSDYGQFNILADDNPFTAFPAQDQHVSIPRF